MLFFLLPLLCHQVGLSLLDDLLLGQRLLNLDLLIVQLLDLLLLFALHSLKGLAFFLLALQLGLDGVLAGDFLCSELSV